MSCVFGPATVAIWQMPDPQSPNHFDLRGYVLEGAVNYAWPDPAGPDTRSIDVQHWHLLGTFVNTLQPKTKLMLAAQADIDLVETAWPTTAGSQVVTSASVSYDHVPLAHETSVDTLLLADYILTQTRAARRGKHALQISPNFKLFNPMQGGKLLKVFPVRVANTNLKVELWYCGDFQMGPGQEAMLQATNNAQPFPATGKFILMVSR